MKIPNPVNRPKTKSQLQRRSAWKPTSALMLKQRKKPVSGRKASPKKSRFNFANLRKELTDRYPWCLFYPQEHALEIHHVIFKRSVGLPIYAQAKLHDRHNCLLLSTRGHHELTNSNPAMNIACALKLVELEGWDNMDEWYKSQNITTEPPDLAGWFALRGVEPPLQ